MANKKQKFNPKDISISIKYTDFDDHGGLDVTFKPNPLNPDVILKKHIMVLAEGFAQGLQKLVSIIKELPEPTEEDVTNYDYRFGDYGGGDTFALYQYRKSLMEDVAAVVDNAITTTFHRELFVKGVQEKIFAKIKEERLKAAEETEGTDAELVEPNKEEEIKGGVN